MKMLVDADACPLKEEIVNVGLEANIKVILISSVAHFTRISYQGEERITVDNNPQAVDMAIIERVQPGDVVVTQDYGLAALVLTRGGIPLTPRGVLLTEENIDSFLERRHLAMKVRKARGRLHGPPSLSCEEKRKCINVLHRLINAHGHEKKDLKKK